jgi:predicted transcriptional regulator
VIAVAENEPAGTTEVVNELGIARQSADYRLRRLLDDRRVPKKKVGNSLVWSVKK